MDKFQLHADNIRLKSALSVSYLRLINQILLEEGHDTASWIAHAGIKKEDLLDPNGFISFEQIEKLLSDEEIVASFNYIGLLLGQKLTMSAHGIVGHLAMAGKTYLDGLKLFERFTKIRTQLICLRLELSDDFLIINFDTNVEHSLLHHILADSALSGSYHLISQFVGDSHAVHSVEFNYAQPEDLSLHKACFDCPMVFGSRLRILINIDAVSQVSISSNPVLLKTAQQQCEMIFNELNNPDSITDRVFALLQATPEYCFNQLQLAECLNMSSRTLRRKLADERSHYQQLVDRAQQMQAKSYLENTEWSIDEIADLMGYSDASSFNKAFIRWQGCSAANYRK